MGESLRVCGYERCGKAFDAPLRLTNLSHKSRSETYYVCPYCFSKVDDSEIEHVHEGSYEAPEAESVKKNPKSGGQKESLKVSESENCPYQIGYLKKRSKDQSVPDTCLTCPKILQCMV